MPILDQYGNPITGRPPTSQQPSPVVGLEQRYQSYPSRGLTPEKLSRIIYEADEGFLEQQAELFSEMEERDGKLAQVMQDRKLSAVGIEWRIEPADNSAQAGRLAEAFREWWENSSRVGWMLDLQDALGQGVSQVGVAWQRQGGLWFPGQMEHIEARFLVWDFELKRFKIRSQEHPQGYLPPYGQVVEHRYKARAGSPTRAGLMRTNAWWYLFKHYAVKDWVVYAEVFGQPYRLGKYDPATGKDELAALERAVRALGTDAAGIISKDTEIEIIEVSRATGGPDVYRGIYELANREMTLATLGQTLTSGEGEHGTQALGREHRRTRTDLLEVDVQALAGTIRRDLARPFTAFNAGPENLRLAPKVIGIIEEGEDLAEKAKTLDILQQMGYPISQRWVAEKFGVPEPAPDEPVLARLGAALQAPLRAAQEARTPLAALERELRPGMMSGQQFIFELVGASTEEAAQAIAPALERLVREIQAAPSPERLRQRLIELFPELDIRSMRRLVEAAWLLGEMAGMLAQREDL
ncbi:DUF935 family protein [uncultured Meiothermus sp.]|jgi:phage gp29-like protein|uniref:DUF935 domain-containing protein n=1 Tax=uncultured Meiothermus sp. TaxID=157471 RepID=UPI00261F88C7|nr:DUF935 family protein [uncultured Meiothermus sp.]